MKKNQLLSIFVWIGVSLVSIFMYFIMQITCIILFPFDKDRRIAHIQAFWWASGITALIPSLTINVKGRENIKKDEAYVIVANHKSMMDIFVMYKIRHEFKWVAKESLFTVPFLGWMMSMHIPLILSTRSAPHCPVNPLYAVHLSERSDACFYYIKEPVRLI